MNTATTANRSTAFAMIVRAGPRHTHIDEIENSARPVKHDERRHDEPQRGRVGDPGGAERQHCDGQFRRPDEVDEQILRPLQVDPDQRGNRGREHSQYERRLQG